MNYPAACYGELHYWRLRTVSIRFGLVALVDDVTVGTRYQVAIYSHRHLDAWMAQLLLDEDRTLYQVLGSVVFSALHPFEID